MDCPIKTGEGAELFIAYGAGTLPSEAEAELQEHLKACVGCRGIAEAQAEVWQTLDAWIPEPISSNFDEKLFARIASEEKQSWWRRWLGGDVNVNWSWKPAMPVAAACAALLAAFLLKSPAPEHRPQASVQNIDIEQVERALDDIDMLKQLGLASAPAPAGHPAHSTSM